MKLLIRNLARTTTESELLELFEAFGKIQSCSLILDKETGGSKGFAFIEMPMIGEAKAAMKAINGTEVAGNKLRVKRAESKASANKPENDVKGNESKAVLKKAGSTSSESVWKRKK